MIYNEKHSVRFSLPGRQEQCYDKIDLSEIFRKNGKDCTMAVKDRKDFVKSIRIGVLRVFRGDNPLLKKHYIRKK